MEGRLAAWETEASRAFLDAYFEAARGSRFCPADRADAERVVRFFMLEKALYEVAYELANRPDWVVIPLRGVLALLDSEAAPLVKRTHRMPFGAELQADGRVRFRLWAPPHREVQIELDGETVADATDRRGLARAPHRSRPRRYAISLRPAGWPSRAGPGLAVSAGGCARAERGGRSGGLCLARRRLERPSLGGGGRLRAAHRRFYAGGHVSRGDRKARSSGCAWRHRDRDHADR